MLTSPSLSCTKCNQYHAYFVLSLRISILTLHPEPLYFSSHQILLISSIIIYRFTINRVIYQHLLQLEQYFLQPFESNLTLDPTLYLLLALAAQLQTYASPENKRKRDERQHLYHLPFQQPNGTKHVPLAHLILHPLQEIGSLSTVPTLVCAFNCLTYFASYYPHAVLLQVH